MTEKSDINLEGILKGEHPHSYFFVVDPYIEDIVRQSYNSILTEDKTNAIKQQKTNNKEAYQEQQFTKAILEVFSSDYPFLRHDKAGNFRIPRVASVTLTDYVKLINNGDKDAEYAFQKNVDGQTYFNNWLLNLYLSYRLMDHLATNALVSKNVQTIKDVKEMDFDIFRLGTPSTAYIGVTVSDEIKNHYAEFDIQCYSHRDCVTDPSILSKHDIFLTDQQTESEVRTLKPQNPNMSFSNCLHKLILGRSKKSLRILLVDDEYDSLVPTALKLYSDLRSFDVKISSVIDTEHAMRLINDRDYNVVISDKNLHDGESGINFLEKVRKKVSENAQFYLISGATDNISIEEFMTLQNLSKTKTYTKPEHLTKLGKSIKKIVYEKSLKNLVSEIRTDFEDLQNIYKGYQKFGDSENETYVKTLFDTISVIQQTEGKDIEAIKLFYEIFAYYIEKKGVDVDYTFEAMKKKHIHLDNLLTHTDEMHTNDQYVPGAGSVLEKYLNKYFLLKFRTQGACANMSKMNILNKDLSRRGIKIAPILHSWISKTGKGYSLVEKAEGTRFFEIFKEIDAASEGRTIKKRQKQYKKELITMMVQHNAILEAECKQAIGNNVKKISVSDSLEKTIRLSMDVFGLKNENQDPEEEYVEKVVNAAKTVFKKLDEQKYKFCKRDPNPKHFFKGGNIESKVQDISELDWDKVHLLTFSQDAMGQILAYTSPNLTENERSYYETLSLLFRANELHPEVHLQKDISMLKQLNPKKKLEYDVKKHNFEFIDEYFESKNEGFAYRCLRSSVNRCKRYMILGRSKIWSGKKMALGYKFTELGKKLANNPELDFISDSYNTIRDDSIQYLTNAISYIKKTQDCEEKSVLLQYFTQAQERLENAK